MKNRYISFGFNRWIFIPLQIQLGQKFIATPTTALPNILSLLHRPFYNIFCSLIVKKLNLERSAPSTSLYKYLAMLRGSVPRITKLSTIHIRSLLLGFSRIFSLKPGRNVRTIFCQHILMEEMLWLQMGIEWRMEETCSILKSLSTMSEAWKTPENWDGNKQLCGRSKQT